jgi:NAD(P)-dependent dehydrogenase (short-subunit alcohol dehydrogenase family)
MLSKAMLLNDSGSLNQKNIINILDSDTLRIPKNFTSYHVSKKSLEYFTEIAALQLAPIRVNAIALGYMLKNERQRQEHFDAFAKSNPLQHQISGKELMQTIDYLINNQAVTGQIIKLDAGCWLNGALQY